MNSRFFTLFSLLAMASASQVMAANEYRLDDLVDARNQVASAALNTKGQPRADLDIERFRLNRLIADLEAGQSVEPMRIDDEIRRAMRLYR